MVQTAIYTRLALIMIIAPHSTFFTKKSCSMSLYSTHTKLLYSLTTYVIVMIGFTHVLARYQQQTSDRYLPNRALGAKGSYLSLIRVNDRTI